MAMMPKRVKFRKSHRGKGECDDPFHALSSSRYQSKQTERFWHVFRGRRVNGRQGL